MEEGAWWVVTWERYGQMYSLETLDMGFMLRLSAQLAEQGRERVTVIPHTPEDVDLEELQGAFERGRAKLLERLKMEEWTRGATPAVLA